MNIRRRFLFFICAGLLTSAALYGCGSSTAKETIPSTVSIFNAHSVIFRNGSTFTMGYNGFGQLGDGTLVSRATATVVQIPEDVVQGVAGAEHTIVRFDNNSSVKAWGYNLFGQIGSAEVPTTGNAYTSTPVKVPLHSIVQDVAAGGFHSLAVADGNIYGWGYNGNGQVGDNTLTNSAVPTLLATDSAGAPLPQPFAKVAAGALHSLALSTDGSVYAWGNNTYNQLGFTNNSTAVRPRKVSLPQAVGTVTQIQAGARFSVALDELRVGGVVTQQRLWGWGSNSDGELGLNPAVTGNLLVRDPRPVFSVDVTDPATDLVIKQVATGLNHILLLMAPAGSVTVDDKWVVKAIGYNFFGQLGNNTTQSSFQLVHTFNTDATVNPDGTQNLQGVSAIAAFGYHSLALVNGVWYGWGNNNFGQLGSPVPLSSASNPKRPVRVQGLP